MKPGFCKEQKALTNVFIFVLTYELQLNVGSYHRLSCHLRVMHEGSKTFKKVVKNIKKSFVDKTYVKVKVEDAKSNNHIKFNQHSVTGGSENMIRNKALYSLIMTTTRPSTVPS